MNELRLQSPAKINWFLRLLGQNLDGYHSLQSAMQCIDLCDRIRLIRLERAEIEFVADTDLASNGPNSCERAAGLLRQASYYAGGVRIELHKRIPLRAGLGGGSSNAAAVLLGLNRLWGTALSRADLLSLAGRIGSDVAFFVSTSCAWVEGTGDRIYPWPGAEVPLLLFVCRQGFSTAARYMHPDLERAQRPVDRGKYDGRSVADLIEMGNVFENLSRLIDAQIPQIFDLAGHFGQAFMTGSGSTVVVATAGGFSAHDEIYRRARDELAQRSELAGWNLIQTRTCVRSALHDSLESGA